MQPFQPLFRSSHLQTIAAHFWRRPNGGPLERRLYRTEPDVQVLVETQHPRGVPAGHIVLVHGLEGSGQAGYMQSMSHTAVNAGFAAHRFHMRTCGGTEHLCRTLYHSGLTSDLLSVLRQFAAESRTPVYLVGFSLGANIVLKLAGELGTDAVPLISGVCGVSTPLDLAACARRIGQAENRLYELRFLRRMRQRLLATGRYRPADFRGIRSIVGIDDRITAPSFGFSGAEHYYRTQSAGQFLQHIRVPTLLIQAKDDTFIPFSVFDNPALSSNPFIQVVATEHGGHVGFLSRTAPRFWLDHAVLDWVVDRKHLPQPAS